MLSIAVNHKIGADTLMAVMRVVRTLTGQRNNERYSDGGEIVDDNRLISICTMRKICIGICTIDGRQQ